MNINARLEDKPDQEIFGKYGLRGFPTVLFLAPDGTRLFDFRPTSEDVTTEAAADAAMLVSTDAKLAKNPKDPVALAEQKLVSGMRGVEEVSDEELAKAAAVEGVDSSLVRRFKSFMAIKPIKDILDGYMAKMRSGTITSTAEAQEFQKETGEKLYNLLKEGTPAPSPTADEALMFWYFVVEAALEKKDKVIGLQGIEALSKSPMAQQPSFQAELDQRRKQFEEME